MDCLVLRGSIADAYTVNPRQVLDCDYVLTVDDDGTVLTVGLLIGLLKADRRHRRLLSAPLPTHLLIGQRLALNDSRNPVTYLPTEGLGLTGI